MIVLRQIFADGKAPACETIHNYHTNHWVGGGALEFWDGVVLDMAMLSCYLGEEIILIPLANLALGDSNVPI